ncbi:MAG: hypothetical protein H6Q60_1176 [Oscillospiraceae bacterium]|nr:hypothetical protein [Oscillospiraceae bacterium]
MDEENFYQLMCRCAGLEELSDVQIQDIVSLVVECTYDSGDAVNVLLGEI